MRRVAAVLVWVAAVLVGATPVGAADDPAPCDLLTRKEIRRVFDQKAAAPTQELGPTFCQWVLAATADRAPGQVNALLETGKAAKRDYRLGRQLAGSLAERVDDLGKKAFFTPDTGTIYVLAPGPALFYLQANVYDAEANRITDGLRDQLVELATDAEARL